MGNIDAEVYEIKKIQVSDASLYFADCLDVMRNLQDNSVDIIITDPPYFLPAQHYSTRKQFKRRLSDLGILEYFFEDVFNQFHRILKNDGCAYVFCDAQSYPIFYAVAYRYFKRLTALVWDKMNSINGFSWRHQYELIFFGEMPEYPAIKTGDGDILKQKPVGIDTRIHPAEKPVELLRKLIKKSNKDNGVVFDCFMGSGATGEAALLENAKFIGVESDNDYFEIAKTRLLRTGEYRSAQIKLSDNMQLFCIKP